jgi:hypothetical protein
LIALDTNALFWPSLYEFLRVVTHHRVFDPPSTPAEALMRRRRPAT